MKRQRVLRLRAFVAVAACLVATTAYARLMPAIFHVSVPNINFNGTLDFGNVHTYPLAAIINTNNGTFIGSAKGVVLNKSLLPHVYPNPHLYINFGGGGAGSDTNSDKLIIGGNGVFAYCASGNLDS